jgi:iron complex outermembrane receptor protein
MPASTPPAPRAPRTRLAVRRLACLFAALAPGVQAMMPFPAGVASAPLPAGATAADLAELPLEQLMAVPVESVSGVSKYEQSIRRAPAGVTVYTAADIRNYGWRTLADALRAAPGFHIRHDRFYEYVGNRGFTRPYDYNSRTLILVNGHRINDSIYQQGAVGTDFLLDIDLVERIEIIRGPGSSIYGSNAFYGAVNVIPKRGRDLAGGQAALAVGSEPSVKGRVSVGDRSSGGVEYTLSATGWSSEGERDFSLPASWRALPGFTAREARDRDDLSVANAFGHVAWRGLEAEAAYGRRRKDVLPPVYFTNVDTPAFGIDERAYALVRATGEPTPSSQISAKLAFDLYRYEGLFSPAFTGFEQQAPYADSFSANAELRWRQTIADRHTLLVGFEYQDNFRQDLGRRNLTTGEVPVRVRESSRYYSPFAQLDWELAEPLRLSLGGRYDYYDFGQERLTPRVGLIWDLSASTTLKLLYGESFRVPNVEERFASEAGIVANPDLRPETNRTWDLLAEHRLNQVWRLEANAYHIVSSDLITTVPFPAIPDTITYANSQRITTEGFSLGASAHYPSGVQLRASGTFQRTRDDATDDVIADAPRTLVKLAASSPLGARWLRGSVEVQYVGDREDALGRSTGDYTTANVTLRASQVWHRWDLSLSVYNIAGDRWSDPKNVGQIDSVPRTAVLRATLDF